MVEAMIKLVRPQLEGHSDPLALCQWAAFKVAEGVVATTKANWATFKTYPSLDGYTMGKLLLLVVAGKGEDFAEEAGYLSELAIYGPKGGEGAWVASYLLECYEALELIADARHLWVA